MKGFINAKTYVHGEGFIVTNVAVENGKIVAIGNDVKIDQPFPYTEGQIVVPGFIDQHVHGANSSDGMDANLSALKNISTALATEGTTSFLVTTMTQSKENIKNALSAVNTFISNYDNCGAEALGVHLEGPFISSKHIGAQPPEYVIKPDVDTFNEFYTISGNNIKIVSLAPEEDGALELIKELVKKGVVPSVGHSDAGYEDIKKAIGVGLKNVTHTFNAQKGIHHREVGVAGSALLFDEVYAEIICDLVHLSIPAIKLVLKNKPKDKVILITDAIRAKGLSDGESELGGQKVYVSNGEARLSNGALAGSTLKMNVSISNLVKNCGAKLEDVIDYATINPATNLKVAYKIGSIKVGKNADFAVLDNEYNVMLTVKNGEIIYSA